MIKNKDKEKSKINQVGNMGGANGKSKSACMFLEANYSKNETNLQLQINKI